MLPIRKLLGLERWYVRAGSTAAANRPALTVLNAVSYSTLAVDVLEIGEGLTVRIASADPSVLEDYAADLAAVDVEVTWFPVRRSDRRPEEHRQAKRLRRAIEHLGDAMAGDLPTGPTPEVVMERMGQAAVAVQPPTEASTRVRKALADAYARHTGDELAPLERSK